MNIFVLDYDPEVSAKYHCDKHTVKMITEYAQLLCSAYYYTGQEREVPYKLSHRNHPCAIWARTSLANWLWLCVQGIALYEEYRFRYGNKTHLAGEVIHNLSTHYPELPSIGLTPYPQCMPDGYKSEDVVEAYRKYYLGEKKNILQYTRRDKPYWIEEKL